MIPSAKAWTLYLDVLILSSAAGNLIDLTVLAARSALANVRLPQTRSIGFDGGDDEADEGDAQMEGGTHVTQDEGFSGLVKGGKAGKKAVDFELVDGGEQGERLDGWQDLPIAITFDLVSSPILSLSAETRCKARSNAAGENALLRSTKCRISIQPPSNLPRRLLPSQSRSSRQQAPSAVSPNWAKANSSTSG